MNLSAFFAGAAGKKFLLAAVISVSFHFIVAAFVEASMTRKVHQENPMPVEISRRTSEGAPVRKESPINTELPPSEDPTKGISAGVPVAPSTPQPQTQPQPISNQPQPQQKPRNEPNLPNMQPSNIGVPIQSGTSDSQPQAEKTPTRTDQDPPRPIAQPSPEVRSGGGTLAPRSRGPNRGPMPLYTEEPKVPANLAGPGVTNSVGVKVDIKADGTSVVSIQRSSGSSEVDQIVLEALRRWKWDPAAENAVPIATSETFKYVFKIG